jgi:DNA-binding transcriptional MerR regulator
MMKRGNPLQLPLAVEVPDRIVEKFREWHGTADELADLAAKEFDEGVNVRLIRYYIAEDLMTPPGRRGSFDVTQLIQLIFIRQLLSKRVSIEHVKELMKQPNWNELAAPGSPTGVDEPKGLDQGLVHSQGQRLERWELRKGCELLLQPAALGGLTDYEINQMTREFAAAVRQCRNTLA